MQRALSSLALICTLTFAGCSGAGTALQERISGAKSTAVIQQPAGRHTPRHPNELLAYNNNGFNKL